MRPRGPGNEDVFTVEGSGIQGKMLLAVMNLSLAVALVATAVRGHRNQIAEKRKI